MTLELFLERNPQLDPQTARTAWDAAIDAAYDTALERALEKRARIHSTHSEIDQEHAAAGFLEARQVASLVHMLKARL